MNESSPYFNRYNAKVAFFLSSGELNCKLWIGVYTQERQTGQAQTKKSPRCNAKQHQFTRRYNTDRPLTLVSFQYSTPMYNDGS